MMHLMGRLLPIPGFYDMLINLTRYHEGTQAKPKMLRNHRQFYNVIKGLCLLYTRIIHDGN